MKKTRLSLYYLLGYLFFGGTGLLFFPNLSLRLLLSNSDYSVVMLKLVGVLLLALAIVVLQIIRLEEPRMYKTTLLVRSWILLGLIYLYVIAKDPMMLVLIGIVGFGVVLTLTTYLFETRHEAF